MERTTIDVDVYTPEGKRAVQVSTPVLGKIKLKRFRGMGPVRRMHLRRRISVHAALIWGKFYG